MVVDQQLETPPNGVVWEAVTKDGHVVIICPSCSHRYARCRQRNTKFR